jgi:hypothetical protein
MPLTPVESHTHAEEKVKIVLFRVRIPGDSPANGMT